MMEREFTFGDEIEPEMDTADLQGPAVDPALIPEPCGYRVIVRPKPAAEKHGSIFVAARTKNTDLAVRTIGQVLKIGPLAWTATFDGMDYRTDQVAHSIREGDWVIFRQNAAQKIKIGRGSAAFDGDEPEDQFLLILSDTDIFAKLTPEQARTFFDWVS